MTEHTPGPWTAGQCAGGGWSVLSDGLMTDIAIVDGREDQGSARLCRLQPGVDEANARLIAAAPDLLAALERIRDNDTSGCSCDHDSESCCAAVGEFCGWCIAGVAIAKAEGR